MSDSIDSGLLKAIQELSLATLTLVQQLRTQTAGPTPEGFGPGAVVDFQHPHTGGTFVVESVGMHGMWGHFVDWSKEASEILTWQPYKHFLPFAQIRFHIVRPAPARSP